MNMPVIIPDIDDDDLSICSQTDNSAVPQHAYLVYGDIDAERPVAECGYHTHDLRTDPPSSSLSRSPQDTAQAQSPEAMTPFGQQCELVHDYVYPLQDHPTEIIDILCQMKRSPQCEAIQARGCEGLWVHSWDDHASDAIGEVGGIPTSEVSMRSNSKLGPERVQPINPCGQGRGSLACPCYDAPSGFDSDPAMWMYGFG
jgi:hypothetical protein